MRTSVASSPLRTHANPRRAALDDLRAGDNNARMGAKTDENPPKYRALVLIVWCLVLGVGAFIEERWLRP